MKASSFSLAVALVFPLIIGADALAQGGLGAQKTSARGLFLKKILEPFVLTLPRDVAFYHWGKRGAPTSTDSNEVIEEVMDLPGTVSGVNAPSKKYEAPVPLRPVFTVRESHGGSWNRYPLQDYFRFMSEAFFRNRKEKDWLWGPALYASTDPLTSIHYARDPSFLLSIGVKKGTRFLDLRRYDHALPVRPSALTRREWDQHARLWPLNQYAVPLIGSRGESPGTRYWLDILRFRNDPTAWGDLQEAFGLLNVEFIAATWVGTTLAYAPCRGGNQAYLEDSSSVEVMFVDPKSVNQLDLKVFVEALESAPQESKRSEYRFMREMMASASFPAEHDAHYASYLMSWEQALKGQKVDLSVLHRSLTGRNQLGLRSKVYDPDWDALLAKNSALRGKEGEFASRFFGCSSYYSGEAIPVR